MLINALRRRYRYCKTLRQISIANDISLFQLFLLNGITLLTGHNFHYAKGAGVSIKGHGVFLIDDFIDFGITGCHDVFRKMHTVITNQGTVCVKGYASIGKGCKVFVAKNKTLTIGCNTFLTGDSLITVNNGVSIGSNCAISWNLTLIDDDYHQLLPVSEKDKNIIIGDNVWIGNNVTILKGAVVGKGSVIAANSVVTKAFPQENVLLAGNPAKIIRENINWKR